jgi:hypothetical protein
MLDVMLTEERPPGATAPQGDRHLRVEPPADKPTLTPVGAAVLADLIQRLLAFARQDDDDRKSA